MQDQTFYSQMNNPIFPEQEHLNCPRCDSPNTKFCYYNNYNLSQPRHYCKNCKRYWTKGGALRNIPVGGGSRKNSKRSSTTNRPPSSSSASSSSPSSTRAPTLPSSSSVLPSVSSSITTTQTGSLSSPNAAFNQGSTIFNALLVPVNQGQSSGLSQDRPDLRLAEFVTQIPGSASGSGSVEGRTENNNSTSSSCWNSGSDWPHLSIFTPGSNFQ